MSTPGTHLMLTPAGDLIHDGQPYRVVRWDLHGRLSTRCHWCPATAVVPVELYRPAGPTWETMRAQDTQLPACACHAEEFAERNTAYAIAVADLRGLGAEQAPDSPQGAELVATADNVDALELVYDSTPCSRCGGRGRVPRRPSNGLCYQCQGRGRSLTAAGRRALARFEQLSADTPPAPRDEIQIGDRIFTHVPHQGRHWCEVLEREAKDLTQEFQAIGRREPGQRLLQLTLGVRAPDGQITRATDRMEQGYMTPRADAATLAALYNKVAKLKGARLQARAENTG